MGFVMGRGRVNGSALTDDGDDMVGWIRSEIIEVDLSRDMLMALSQEYTGYGTEQLYWLKRGMLEFR